MDGIATTRAIRKAVGNDVPIIIISAYDWSDIEQEARAAGANAFISKPLFRSRLTKTFNTLVGDEKAQEPNIPFVDLKNMDLTGRRALLVEDNELNAEIAIEILQEAGFMIELAEDGQICVDMLNRAPAGYYNLILMDIQMPHMNGYQAARTIRALKEPEKANIPILAMTANAFEEDKREAFRSGMNGHLAKPVNVRELMRELANILG